MRGKILHFNKSENKHLRLPTQTGASRKTSRPHFVSKGQKEKKRKEKKKEKKKKKLSYLPQKQHR
jgi:hypothetical protein